METSAFSIFLTEKITNHVFYEYKGEVLGSHMQKKCVCALLLFYDRFHLNSFTSTIPSFQHIANVMF